MERIIDGVKQFGREVFDSKRELYKKLKAGQSPEAAFVACSDSRVIPNLFTQTDPGDLFVIRNAGNIVPAYDPSVATSEAGTIEYAVSALKVKHIVVCGHSHCGAMQGLLNPDSLTELPTVGMWLRSARSTLERVQTLYPDLTGADLIARTIETNVLQQLKNLETHPSVAAAMASGSLQLHGWTYVFETGEVWALDPDGGAATLLTDNLA